VAFPAYRHVRSRTSFGESVGHRFQESRMMQRPSLSQVSGGNRGRDLLTFRTLVWSSPLCTSTLHQVHGGPRNVQSRGIRTRSAGERPSCREAVWAIEPLWDRPVHHGRPARCSPEADSTQVFLGNGNRIFLGDKIRYMLQSPRTAYRIDKRAKSYRTVKLTATCARVTASPVPVDELAVGGGDGTGVLRLNQGRLGPSGV
jgi:hypothetical protein